MIAFGSSPQKQYAFFVSENTHVMKILVTYMKNGCLRELSKC